MPRIFDNVTPNSSLLSASQKTLGLSSRADFCVGYFNLRGWAGLAPFVDNWQPCDDPAACSSACSDSRTTTSAMP